VTTQKSSPDLTMVVHLSRRTAATTRCTCATTRCSTSRTSSRASRRRRRAAVRRRRLRMRVWLDPDKVAARGLTPATWCARSASRTCRSRPAWSARRRCPATRLPALRQRAGPAATRRSSATSSSRPAPTARSRGCATSRASSSAPATIRCARCSTTSRRWHRHLPGARLQRARRSPTRARRWTS
jgi:hypothetical protein